MSAIRSPAQQTASRATGTRSRGPTTEAGEDREEFCALHAAVTADWGPRDAYERRWVMELVTSMWRQDRLRGLELATLTAAAEESPPSDATMKKLTTFARYGARIDKDIGRALQALRVLRGRPDAWIDELQERTPKPSEAEPRDQDYTNDFSPRTPEPRIRQPHDANCTIKFSARTLEPEPANRNLQTRTSEPEPPALNRHERRRHQALARKRHAA